jgi:hypothetical protein
MRAPSHLARSRTLNIHSHPPENSKPNNLVKVELNVNLIGISACQQDRDLEDRMQATACMVLINVISSSMHAGDPSAVNTSLLDL